jgi:hypothetical protein
MGRNFISWVGLGVAMGLALQPAHAGDRKSVAVTTYHAAAAASARNFVFAAQVRSSGDDHGGGSIMKVQGRGDLPFFPVTPLESRLPRSGTAASTSDDQQKEKGPTTPPHERKSITLFRFDSKLGNVSVQPVVGGVNGAQLSVGF